MLPLAPEVRARIDEMFKKMAPFMDSLQGRWLDEQEYEDFEEYKEAVVKALPPGFTMTKMKQRPFSFEFHIGTEQRFSVFCTAKQIGWKRLADAKVAVPA